jgi:hypothetical protein
VKLLQHVATKSLAPERLTIANIEDSADDKTRDGAVVPSESPAESAAARLAAKEAKLTKKKEDFIALRDTQLMRLSAYVDKDGSPTSTPIDGRTLLDIAQRIEDAVGAKQLGLDLQDLHRLPGKNETREGLDPEWK